MVIRKTDKEKVKRKSNHFTMLSEARPIVTTKPLDTTLIPKGPTLSLVSSLRGQDWPLEER